MTGTGMDAAMLARAGEPFFTTKGPGAGTGLGLPMARGFAEQSGGGLAIVSSPGHGTATSRCGCRAPPTPRHPAGRFPHRKESPGSRRSPCWWWTTNRWCGT